MGDDVDAIVLGAGVVGMTTAYALARRGLSVLIVDRASEPARGTSFANGAQLSYAYTDALAAPALLARLPWLLLATDPAFRLRPSLDPDFLRWGLEFLRNSTAARFHANTLAGLRLAVESRLAMHRLLADHPLDFGHATPGKIHVYSDRTAFAAARELVALKRSVGFEQHALSPTEAIAAEPALGSTGDMVGAIHSPQEEVGDPYRFCAALLERLRADYGVRTRFHSPVSRIDLAGARPAIVTDAGERIETKEIAVCAGVDAPQLLRGIGIRAPIWPMKGHSLTAPRGSEAPTLSITDVARKLVFCGLSGRMRIAGLADLGNRNLKIDKRRLATLIASAKRSLPRAVDYSRIGSVWSGLRPMTPNSLPLIERAKPGVVVNIGHGALGWTYAMGAAERAAALVVEQPC